MQRFRAVVAVGVIPASVLPTHVRAQRVTAEQATRAAVGVGWSTGLIGAEYVLRSVPRTPRLGGALTAGLLGPGARVNLALLPATRRAVPYAGAGVTTNLWSVRAGVGTGGLRDTRAFVALEGGVQLWPVGRRGLYIDL